MKVIDLLNKIANGEEVPNFIVGEVEYYMGANGYLRECMSDDTQWYIDKSWLNTEARILEEPKGIPKRIQSNGENLYSEYIGQWLINKENYTEYDELLMNKINEIIDYLESKGETNE